MIESRTEALLHPVRMRIVMLLAARSGLSAQQIGEALGDVPQASLYRHLNRLTRAGILQIVAERPSGGAHERIYALPAGAGFLSPEDAAQASREDHMRYFSVFCTHLMTLFASYTEQRQEPIDLAADGVGYHTHPLYVNDEEYREFVAELSQLLAKYSAKEPSPRRKRRTFSTVLLPDYSHHAE